MAGKKGGQFSVWSIQGGYLEGDIGWYNPEKWQGSGSKAREAVPQSLESLFKPQPQLVRQQAWTKFPKSLFFIPRIFPPAATSVGLSWLALLACGLLFSFSFGDLLWCVPH